MKKLIFFGMCLLALSSQPVLAQTGGTEIVVVRTSETSGNLIIVRPAGKATEISLNPGISKKALTESGQTIQAILDSLYGEGYELKSTYSAGATTTLILVRRK